MRLASWKSWTSTVACSEQIFVGFWAACGVLLGTWKSNTILGRSNTSTSFMHHTTLWSCSASDLSAETYSDSLLRSLGTARLLEALYSTSLLALLNHDVCISSLMCMIQNLCIRPITLLLLLSVKNSLLHAIRTRSISNPQEAVPNKSWPGG